MARRRGVKAQQVAGRDFAQQSEAKTNFALSAARGTSAQSGNMGKPAIAGMYGAKKMSKSAGGSATNFERRGRKGVPNKMKYDPPQKPFVSNRQYGQPAIATMSQ